ncbi:MAG: flavodoxin family protein [Oscillospiraceae bacterium]
MKYSIVFSSQTGNTAALAEKVREQLPKEDCVYYGSPGKAALSAQVIFLGFWTDRGSCDADTISFLKKLHKKTIYLFGTAGFGQNDDYFIKVLNNIEKELPVGNKIRSSFMCQGKMQSSVRKKYEEMLAVNPQNEKMAEMINNFDKALNHPNNDDFDNLSKWLERIVK